MKETFSQSSNFMGINKYALVVSVAKRAREITERYSLNGEDCPEKAVSLAIADFKSGRCSMSFEENN